MYSVRMTKTWDYDFVDQNGEIVTRTCPKDLVLELDDEVAAAAVATGHAETLRPPTPAFAELVRLHKRYLDLLGEYGDADEASRALLEEEQQANATGDAEVSSDAGTGSEQAPADQGGAAKPSEATGKKKKAS